MIKTPPKKAHTNPNPLLVYIILCEDSRINNEKTQEDTKSFNLSIQVSLKPADAELRKRQWTLRSAKNGYGFRKNRAATSFFAQDVVKYEQSGLPLHKLFGGDPLAGWIVIGVFAAFGMVSAGMTLACLVYFLRCRGTGGWMLLTEQDSLFAGYYHRLSSLGILKCRFLTVSSSDLLRWLEEQSIESTGGEESTDRMTGAEKCDRAGNGDTPGHHQRGGVSEL